MSENSGVWLHKFHNFVDKWSVYSVYPKFFICYMNQNKYANNYVPMFICFGETDLYERYVCF